ncbi:MAG: hypothetical protein NTZ17_09075 [Phycisphaerae bacterium]|nr:hypothetical protein [Phycisphaerae bacterium]
MSGTFSRQGLIGYIVIGGIVLALAIFGFSFTAGREEAAKPAKDKKGFLGRKKGKGAK